MFGLNFNPFKSMTVWGVVTMLVAFLSQPSVLAIFPPDSKWPAIIGAVGGLVTAIGGRNAIANNGPTVTPAESAKANGVTL